MNFHGRMMNIEYGVFGTPSLEYRQGHKYARHAAAEIANEADARIAELERGIETLSQALVARNEAISKIPELQIKLAHAQNVTQAWEDAYTLHREIGSPLKPILPREPHLRMRNSDDTENQSQ